MLGGIHSGFKNIPGAACTLVAALIVDRELHAYGLGLRGSVTGVVGVLHHSETYCSRTFEVQYRGRRVDAHNGTHGLVVEDLNVRLWGGEGAAGEVQGVEQRGAGACIGRGHVDGGLSDGHVRLRALQ